MMKALLLLLLALQYTIPYHTGAAASSGGGTITVETTCNEGLNSSAATSCTVSGLTGGETLYVAVSNHDNNGNTPTDGNGDTFTQIFTAFDSSDPGVTAAYYAKNVSSGSITVQYTTVASNFNIWIQVVVLKGVSTSAPLDSTFSSGFVQASTAGTVANGNCGTARTPSAANEIVLSSGVWDNTTPTAGSGFTFLTNTFGFANFTQYKVQTTATSTNGAFVNAADDWAVGCAAFHS